MNKCGLKPSKPDKYFNKVQLKLGTRIESEHTTHSSCAKIIAKQHLAESPRYYKSLVKMERGLKI